MFDKQISMKLSWDEESDAGYLKFTAHDRELATDRTIAIMDRKSQMYGAIDLAVDGTLIGIELIGVRAMLGADILDS